MQEFKFVPWFNSDYLYWNIYVKRWWGWKKIATFSDYDLQNGKEKLKRFKTVVEEL